MKVQIYGKNITVTPAIAEKVENKLKVLEKYFIIDSDTMANVVVRTYPQGQKIEVTIPTKIALLRAEVTADDLYAAIDLVIDKLEDQIRRQKTRLSRKGKDKLAMAFVEEDEVLPEELLPLSFACANTGIAIVDTSISKQRKNASSLVAFLYIYALDF